MYFMPGADAERMPQFQYNAMVSGMHPPQFAPPSFYAQHMVNHIQQHQQVTSSASAANRVEQSIKYEQDEDNLSFCPIVDVK